MEPEHALQKPKDVKKFNMFTDFDSYPNAPHLTVSISGPSTISLSDPSSIRSTLITTTLTYHTPLSTAPLKPILFQYNPDIWAWDFDFSILHHTSDGLEEMTVAPFCEFGEEMNHDKLPKEVIADEAWGFEELRPGESKVEQWRIWDFDYNEEWVAGDKYSGVFFGGVVSWWDWGTKEEHMDTKLKVSNSWGQRNIVDEESRNGKPKIVIPASEVFEFILEK